MNSCHVKIIKFDFVLQVAVPGISAGLPMGMPSSPGGTPIGGYITHHVPGTADCIAMLW